MPRNKSGSSRGSLLERAAAPLSSVIPIIGGLLVGLIVLFISDARQALPGFGSILTGALQSRADIGNVLYYATPIIMTGLSVAFAFRTSLFNIGAPGQFILGGFGAVLVGVKCTFFGHFQWVAAILFAMLLGAIWGFIPGMLKAFFNVNEVIACIMTNYIAVFFVNMTIVNLVYDNKTNRSLPVADTAKLPGFGLNTLFHGSSANIGIVVAVIIAIVLYILLSKTTMGYELKACGYNRDASRYAGINERKNIILAMIIAGGLAGIGGALMYLSSSGKYINVVDVLPAEGFTGISVALLGISNPIGVIFAGLFIAYIQVGGSYMQLFGFKQEIIQIIIAVIIYFAAFVVIIRSAIDWTVKKSNRKRITEEEEDKAEIAEKEEKEADSDGRLSK